MIYTSTAISLWIWVTPERICPRPWKLSAVVANRKGVDFSLLIALRTSEQQGEVDGATLSNAVYSLRCMDPLYSFRTSSFKSPLGLSSWRKLGRVSRRAAIHSFHSCSHSSPPSAAIHPQIPCTLIFHVRLTGGLPTSVTWTLITVTTFKSN